MNNQSLVNIKKARGKVWEKLENIPIGKIDFDDKLVDIFADILFDIALKIYVKNASPWKGSSIRKEMRVCFDLKIRSSRLQFFDHL